MQEFTTIGTHKIDVKAEVDRMFIEMFELEADRLSPDKRLVEDLGLDSLDAVDLALRFQRQFKVEASTADLQAVRTLADVYQLVEKSVAAMSMGAPKGDVGKTFDTSLR